MNEIKHSDSYFYDIDPVFPNNENNKRSLVTIDNLLELHSQLIQLSNFIIPQKKSLRQRIKDEYIEPYIKSVYSKIVGLFGCLLNIVVLFVETNAEMYNNNRYIFIFLDFLGILIMTSHFIFKMMIFRNIFWKHIWNYIDIICFADTILYYGLYNIKHNEKLLLLIKILRLLHFTRIIRIYRPSGFLFNSIIRAFPNIGLVSYLILLFIIIAATLATSLFSKSSTKMFGSLQNSMFSIFVILSQSGWLKSYWKTESFYPINAKVFFIIVGFFGSFVLMNSFTGISSSSVEKVKKMSEKEKEIKVLKKNNELEKKKTLTKLLERKKSLERIEKIGNITVDDLENSHREMKARLKELNRLYKELDMITNKVFDENNENE